MGVASTSELPAAAKTQLENVASTAGALGLSDCSDTRLVDACSTRRLCGPAKIGLFFSSFSSLCLALSEICCQRAHSEVERQEMIREEMMLQENLRQVVVKQANQKK